MYERLALVGGFFIFGNKLLFLFLGHNVAEFLGGDIFDKLGLFHVGVVTNLFNRPKDNDEQARGDARQVAKEWSESHVCRKVFPEESQSHPRDNDAGKDIDAVLVLREGLDIPAKRPVGADDKHD